MPAIKNSQSENIRYGGIFLVSLKFLARHNLDTTHTVVEDGHIHCLKLFSGNGKKYVIWNVYFSSRDPLLRRQQMERLGKSITEEGCGRDEAQHILPGDMNFAVTHGDRLTRGEDDEYRWCDTRLNDAAKFKKEVLEPNNLTGLFQEEPTLTAHNRSFFPRNDRVYTNSPPARTLTTEMEVRIAAHPPSIVSDHALMHLRISTPQKRALPKMPTWPAYHKDFGTKVKNKMDIVGPLLSSPWHKLMALTVAQWEACDDIKRETKEAAEIPIQGKLSKAIGVWRRPTEGARHGESNERWAAAILAARSAVKGLQEHITPIFDLEEDLTTFEYNITDISSVVNDLFHAVTQGEANLITRNDTEEASNTKFQRESLARKAHQILPGNRKAYGAVRMNNGDFTQDKIDTGKRLMHTWGDKFKSPYVDEEDIYNYLYNVPLIDFPQVDPPNEEDTGGAIKYCGNSAVGVDGAAGIHYRSSIEASTPVLDECGAALSNHQAREPPPYFNVARLVLPPKVDPVWEETVQEFVVGEEEVRPLSIHIFAQRIITGSMRKAVRDIAKATTHKSQIGFLEGTSRNIVKIDSYMHKYARSRIRGGVFLADLIRAFPSSCIVYCIIFLRLSNCPQWLLTAFTRMYNKVTHVYSMHDILLFGEIMYRGLTQGNPPSAFFFIIFVNPLIAQIASLLQEHEAICGFADDISIALRHVRRLIVVLPEFDAFAAASLCVLHPGKSKWVYTHVPTDREKNRCLMPGGKKDWEKIALVAEGLYLGILLGVWTTNEGRYKKALGKFLRTVDRWKSGVHGPSWRLMIANVFLLPIFTYIEQFAIPPPQKMVNDVSAAIVLYVYQIGNTCQWELLTHLKEIGSRFQIFNIQHRSTAAMVRTSHGLGCLDGIEREMADVHPHHIFEAPITAMWQRAEHIVRRANHEKGTAEIFDDLLRKEPIVKWSTITNARKSLQKTVYASLCKDITEMSDYLVKRFKKRWSNVTKTHENDILVLFFNIFKNSTGCKASDWHAGFRFWLNAFFTEARFQRKGQRCRFCGRLLGLSLAIIPAFDRIIEPDLPPEDTVEHISQCPAISNAAIYLGWLRAEDEGWFQTVLRRKFGDPSLGEITEQKSDKNFFKWVGAVFAIHNTIRHDNFAPKHQWQINRAFKKYVEEN